MQLNSNSLKRLEGVHPKLVELVKHAADITDQEFQIIQGLRTLEQQKQFVAAGKSQTMKSYHLVGKAVDFVAIVDGEINWDFKYYTHLSNIFKQAAKDLNLTITWGGDWKTIKDGDHIQLEI